MLEQKQKCLIVWSADWPWDVRINKQIKSLLASNFEVHILCRNSTYIEEEEVFENLRIHRIKNITKNIKLNNILTTPIYLNPLWAWHIFKIVRKVKPDLMIIRDIPLALSAIFFGKFFKSKIILDIAEHYPALMKVNKKYICNPIVKYLICNLKMYDYIEKKAVKKVDSILAVVKESKTRLIRDYNIDSKKIYIVSNTPEQIPTKIEKNRINDKLKIVYTGNVDGVFRGLHVLVEAAKILKNNKNIEFNIIGDGSYLEEIINIKKQNNLENVNILGRFSHVDLLKFLNTQDLGIIPHLSNDVINYTIPNKLFDYMSYSLPVIVSSARPLKRIIEEENCGYVFEAGNSKDLAETILQILKNKNNLEQKGKNGRQAIIKKYNWGNDEKIMISAIEYLIKNDC